MKKNKNIHSIVAFKNHHGFLTSINNENCTIYNFESGIMNNVPINEIDFLFHFDKSIFTFVNEKDFCLFSKDFFKIFDSRLIKLKNIFNLHKYDSSLEELVDIVILIEKHMENFDKEDNIYQCYSSFKNYISNTVFLTSKISQSELGYDDFSTKDIKNLLSHLE